MMKRLLDILLSSLALLVFLPFGFPIAIILRLTGEGETFYRQDRVGKNRKLFKLLKFATMLKNSASIGTGDVTMKNDPRVLPLGGFLRKTKLNEIPQLINILRGDMSIVGPRPLTPKTFAFYSPEDQDVVGTLRPGLSGMGSIFFRDEERIFGNSTKPFDQCYREDISPYKAALEKWYAQHQCLSTDIKIIVVTVWVILSPNSTSYRKLFPGLPQPPENLQRLVHKSA